MKKEEKDRAQVSHIGIFNSLEAIFYELVKLGGLLMFFLILLLPGVFTNNPNSMLDASFRLAGILYGALVFAPWLAFGLWAEHLEKKYLNNSYFNRYDRLEVAV